MVKVATWFERKVRIELSNEKPRR